MIVNFIYNQNVNSAPVGFTATLNAVASFFQSTFSDPVTININVGYGTVNGQPLGGNALGTSLTYLSNYTYTQLRSALAADAKSADDSSSVASLPLPANDPTGGNYWVATAEAKALGLMGASGSVDAFVAFSSSFPFTYDGSHGVAAGTYDFYGVALHELTEGMGREVFAGDHGIGSNSYTPLDLLHYSSPGTRDF